MIDQFGRNINYLRISVTDKCNLRCGYCIPPGQTGLLLPENILTNRQLLRLVSLFAEAGINRIRLTGGEPLLREDLPELIKSIKTSKELITYQSPPTACCCTAGYQICFMRGWMVSISALIPLTRGNTQN